MPHGNERHGNARRGLKTLTYKTWESMIRRCYNESQPSYRFYGARGVTVCDRWRESFEAFLADVGERPPGLTIDRINSALPYQPGNVQWKNLADQQLNRRSNHLLTYDGRTQPLAAWAREFGLKQKTLRARLVDHGMPLDIALTAPLGTWFKPDRWGNIRGTNPAQAKPGCEKPG